MPWYVYKAADWKMAVMPLLVSLENLEFDLDLTRKCETAKMEACSRHRLRRAAVTGVHWMTQTDGLARQDDDDVWIAQIAGMMQPRLSWNRLRWVRSEPPDHEPSLLEDTPSRPAEHSPFSPLSACSRDSCSNRPTASDDIMVPVARYVTNINILFPS